VAWVTGANQGIGAATARALAAQGVAVLLTYLRLDPAEHAGEAASGDPPTRHPRSLSAPRTYQLPEPMKAASSSACSTRVGAWMAVAPWRTPSRRRMACLWSSSDPRRRRTSA
jgi:NAD(P)-dependent dehydrogenase (short-subunit alcohol dehydrogenase family)